MLAGVSDSARLDAEVLLAHTLACPRSRLRARPEEIPGTAARQTFMALVARRQAGEPVAYLTGIREFWSLPLAVSHDTLIPRPETERLVELALECLPSGRNGTVLELGTGTGAIALALASERPDCRIIATDVSPAALAVARANVVRLGVRNVSLLAGDWFEPFGDVRFDLIVSNPPYVADGDPHLTQGDVQHEPRLALAAGPDGLVALRRIVRGAPRHLVAGGVLLVEHGATQGGAVHALFQEAGFVKVATARDLAGYERVTGGSLPRP